MTLCKHEWKTGRNTLLIWAGIICGMTLLTMLLYPSFKDQTAVLTSALSMMGAFTSALGLDQLGLDSAIGFYGIETGTMLSVGGTMFAAFLGIGMLSKEEGNHTAEFLLTQPIPRNRVVLEKLLALVLLLVVFNAIVMGAGALCFAFIAEPLPAGDFITFHLLQLFLHIEIGCICLALSAFARRTQIGLGLGVALLLYFLSLVDNMVDSVAFLRFLTPFTYAEAHIIFTGGKIDGVLLLIGAAITLASVGIALWQYGRKDIAA